MRSVLVTVPCVLALLSVVACSSSDTPATAGGNPDGGSSTTSGNGQPTPTAGQDAGGTKTSAALTCRSHTFCTSYEYKVFGGVQPPAAAGGKVVDGLYRTTYGTTTTAGSSSTSPIDSVLFSGNQYLLAGFGQSEVGTFTTSGSTITFTPTQHCDSYTGDGTTPSAAYSSTYNIDSAGNFVTYYDGANNTPPDTQTTVYGRVDSLCNFPKTPATSPGGDSADCQVTNCGCAENTDGPADAATCKLVSGG